jgi:hypothetical protein
LKKWWSFFLNSANFSPNSILTLVPPSGYALNPKALIKVSKVSRTYQLSYEILRSSFERKFDKTNFISPKKHLLGLNWLRDCVKKVFVRMSQNFANVRRH